MNLSDFQIDYHRNGICGEGFHAIKFKWDDDGEIHSMIGIVFEAQGQCSILDIDILSGVGGVKFGVNSWRGDQFEDDLRKAIRDWSKKRDAEFDAKYPVKKSAKTA